MSSQIIINNSFSKLYNFGSIAVNAVREALTYENQENLYLIKQTKIQLSLAFRYKKFNKINWLKKKLAELDAQTMVCWLKIGDEFPTGHLKIVEDVLKNNGVKYELKDVRENKAPKVEYKWKKELPEARYYQNEMVDLGIIYHRGVFEAAVGTGKTQVQQMLTYYLQTPTLVIVPFTDLCEQLVAEFTKTFGSDQVEFVDSIKKINTTKPIKLVGIAFLNSLEKKGQLEPLLTNIGMIICEEAHHLGASSYVKLLPYFDHIYYRFGFSGTFLRNDSKTLDMWGFISTVLYHYPATKATQEGYLTPFSIIVHDIKTEPGKRRLNYQQEYEKYYCENEDLLEKIKEILKTHVKPEDSVLILVKNKDKSGKIIYEYLNDLGISSVYVDGDSKKKDKNKVKQALIDFNNKTNKILIGSSILGEGIDIRSSDHLIMAQGGKSAVQISQALGRLIRLYPGKIKGFLHDFRYHKDVKYLNAHLDKRLEIYEKNFGGKIIK